jgi:hypothetical protein
MRLLSWDYPEHDNLPELIHQFGLHPLTALTSLNRRQKMFLIRNGLVLCRDAQIFRETFQQLQLSPPTIERIIQESLAVAGIR